MSRNILILGGSKGLGKACVHEFLDKETNVNIYIMSRSCDGKLAKEVNFIETDFYSEESVQNSLDLIRNVDFDVLINNSGGPKSSEFTSVSRNEFMKELQSHILTFHEVTKQVSDSMIKKRRGCIINIISVTAKNPLPNMIVSNTLRGALVNWSKTLSKELAPFGITVNNLLPGYTETSRMHEVITSAAKAKGIEKQLMLDQVRQQIPMDRFGQPHELAKAAYFLSSESASYITGQSIAVDGGWIACV